MKNVGMKPDTLRSAVAVARFYAPRHCLDRIETRDTEKGDPQATARVAGILAAKRTDEILPLCHPLPIHAAEVHFAIKSDHVEIQAEAHTIGPTGVEMEALTAASTAALTLYDMLKPYAEPAELSIGNTHLISKSGGKSHYLRHLGQSQSAAVFTVSTPAANGEASDKQGRIVAEQLEKAGFQPLNYQVLPGKPEAIHTAVDQATANGTALVITVGGTGIGPQDIVTEIIKPKLTLPMPGLMETARAFGQRRTPCAIASRGVAGFIDNSLTLTFPGSGQAAEESLAALLPSLIRIIEVRQQYQS